jgi:hypothetical protein
VDDPLQPPSLFAISGRAAPVAFIVVTHPCFREFENESYLQDGLSFAVKVFDRDKAVQFVDYHWNLSTLLKQSREVGFRLLALTELPDAPGGNPRGAPCSALNASQRVTLTVPHQ